MDHMLPKRRFIHSIQQEALSSYQVHVQTCRRERRVLFLGLFGPAPSVAYASVFFQDSVDRVTVSRLFETPGCWVWQAVCVQIQSQGSVSLGASSILRFHWRRGGATLLFSVALRSLCTKQQLSKGSGVGKIWDADRFARRRCHLRLSPSFSCAVVLSTCFTYV